MIRARLKKLEAKLQSKVQQNCKVVVRFANETNEPADGPEIVVSWQTEDHEA